MLHRRNIITLLAGTMLVGVSAAPAMAQERVSAVTTFSILGDLVSQVGGERVDVTTLVGPDGDGHVYSPSPADARRLTEADIVFKNGLLFEGWIDRLIDSSGTQAPVIAVAENIDAIPDAGHGHSHDDHGHDDHGHDHDDHGHDHDDLGHGHDDNGHGHDDHGHGHDDNGHGHDDHGHDHDDHGNDDHGHSHDDNDHGHDHDDHGHDDNGHGHDDHGHGHDDHGHAHGDDDHVHGDYDPHAWQDVGNVKVYVANIRDALIAHDPDGEELYRANAEAYIAELAALDADIHAAVAELPEGALVVTSHDAFRYFTHAYGLEFDAPVGTSTEVEATARDVARLIDTIRANDIRAVFAESLTDARLIEQIAREAGVPVAGTLYSDALSPPDGPAGTYIDMMRHNISLISEGLGS
ncbi:MAG: zinc ABC transporter substrate-binding protein [Salinarimonas sp.]|nr:zinc ABC transporter substrate-binding protein [Salinarimonas sp.]